jgi:hypothetical protein
MQLNPLKMISSETQKLLLGGLVGSLSYWADMALADTQTAYPAQLKQRLAPQLPRNDELLTSITPVAIMYVVGKKKAKIAELAKGTALYSLPHLMQRVVVNALNPAPVAGLPLRVASAVPNSTTYPKRIPVPSQAYPAQAVGKYR